MSTTERHRLIARHNGTRWYMRCGCGAKVVNDGVLLCSATIQHPHDPGTSLPKPPQPTPSPSV